MHFHCTVVHVFYENSKESYTDCRSDLSLDQHYFNYCLLDLVLLHFLDNNMYIIPSRTESIINFFILNNHFLYFASLKIQYCKYFW